MTNTDTIKALRDALRKAYNFGQTYWQQADSESYSQQAKSSETADKFAAFVDETCAALTADASEDAPFGYVVRQPDGHETYFKDDPAAFRKNGWPELGVVVHTLFDGVAPATILPPVTLDEAALLAGVQCLCIAADQEWGRQEGKLSEWDKGWFLGQLHVFDLYTPVEKAAIAQAREYIEKLSLAARPAPVGATPAPDDLAPLLKFYNVTTLEELARIQDQHIARLQAKLPKLVDESPRTPREG